MSIRCMSFLLFCALSLSPLTAGESLTPTGRETTDREGDLQRRLLESGQAKIAIGICSTKLQSLRPGSDESAKWTIRLSEAIIKDGTSSRPGDSQVWIEAADVLEGWLQSYEESPRAFWVRLARAMVDFRKAQVETLLYRAAPENAQTRLVALASLRRCEKSLNVLQQDITTAIPVAETQPESKLPPGQELRTVAATIGRQLATTQLARTDLYPPGSDDALAAGAAAAEQAHELLLQTPRDDPFFGDIARLEAEAWVRVADQDRATRAIDVLLPPPPDPEAAPPTPNEGQLLEVTAETLSILIRIAILENSAAKASEYLRFYYGTDPKHLTLSSLRFAPPEMDLALLEFLVAGSNPNLRRASELAEAIEQRHGAFYGRIASLMLVRFLDHDVVDADPRMIASAADALLRRGEFNSAATQYARAAQAASQEQGEMATQLLLKAGAAYQKSGQTDQASGALFAAARQQTGLPIAQAASLQAAILLARDGLDKNAERPAKYGEILVHHLNTWPSGQYAAEVRRMLSAHLESHAQWTSAAELWPSIDPARAGRLYRRALRTVEDASARQELLKRSVETLYGSPGGMVQALLLLGLWGSPDQLAKVKMEAFEQQEKTVDSGSKEGQWLAMALSITRFRMRKIDQLDLAGIVDDLEDPISYDLLFRLGADAQAEEIDRPRLQKPIYELARQHAPTIAQVEKQTEVLACLVDSDQWEKALDILPLFPGGASGEAMVLLARQLLDRDDKELASRGIELLTKYARGLKKSTRPWYTVQLEVCAAYQRNQRSEEASKLAKFILLTSPPDDEAVKKQLQGYAQ